MTALYDEQRLTRLSAKLRRAWAVLAASAAAVAAAAVLLTVFRSRFSLSGVIVLTIGYAWFLLTWLPLYVFELKRGIAFCRQSASAQKRETAGTAAGFGVPFTRDRRTYLTLRILPAGEQEQVREVLIDPALCPAITPGTPLTVRTADNIVTDYEIGGGKNA